MSSLEQFSGGRRQGRAPEKSSFVRTCNLLSDYIKEKGSLRDLNIEIGGKIESLQDLILKSRCASTSATMEMELDDGKSAEPLKVVQPNTPQDLSINTHVVDLSPSPKSKEATNLDPKTAPLTIFYSGRVLMFDDYPAEKARELVAFAKNTGPSGGNGAWGHGPRDGLPPKSPPCVSHKAAGLPLTNCEVQKNAILEVEEHLASSSACDLPVARRSSIHRFLEKRKDRAITRGPYQVHEQQASSPP